MPFAHDWPIFKAVDLELRADELPRQGKVWLAYNNPDWIAQRHRLGAGVAPNVEALTKALDALARRATKAQ